MSPLNITQPLGIWSIRVYNGYYKVMSNIPKMGQLPTPEIYGVSGENLFPVSQSHDFSQIHHIHDIPIFSWLPSGYD